MRGSSRFFASACSSAYLCIVGNACGRPAPSPTDSRTVSHQTTVARDESPGAPAAHDAETPKDPAQRAAVYERGPDAASPVMDPYLSGRPTSAKSIGHTSYVLKLRLDNGYIAAFKPRSKLPLGDRRYRGEIAAYRLGRLLGLDNVPTAMPRSFVASDIRSAFLTAEGAVDFDARALVDADGTLRGALMPWIDRYEELPIERGPSRARWERWLTDPDAGASPVTATDRAEARALSTMLVFDYLTGNWDRWSGGNVARDGATGKVLYVDNDGAFYDPPPAAALAGQLELIRRIVRYSRRFVAALRACDESMISDALGEERSGAPLLPPRLAQAIDDRRRTALDVIDAQIARAGEAATLWFE